MRKRRLSGFTTVELAVVLAIVALLSAVAVPNVLAWNDAERVKRAARSVADAFLIARSEAIRTGNHHMVVLGMAMGAPAPVVVADDGPPGTADCSLGANEVMHSVPAEQNVSWGTSSGGANGAAVPSDPGPRPGDIASGFTFSDASGNAASWVLFQSDGLPRFFDPGGGCAAIGNAGSSGGGIYVTNGDRDYAVVLGPLGTAHVHRWQDGAGSWSN